LVLQRVRRLQPDSQKWSPAPALPGTWSKLYREF
jgi:hypothetical protein